MVLTDDDNYTWAKVSGHELVTTSAAVDISGVVLCPRLVQSKKRQR